MALIDINKNPLNINGSSITINGSSITFIEDEKLQGLREYYQQGLISDKDFMKCYSAFPFQIVVDLEAIPEIPEPITSRFDILDIR